MTSQTFSDQGITVDIGHWTNESARTGTSVILFSGLAQTVVDVRGGAPGTRETDLLAPGSQVRACNAIVLTGGSAFGLDSASGVVRFLRERNLGFATPAGPVPIVPAAVIYDLAAGTPTFPDADAGFMACNAAFPLAEAAGGWLGGGTGATVRKFWGPERALRSGLGIGRARTDFGIVTAIVVVNAGGAPTFLDEELNDVELSESLLGTPVENRELQATTIGSVIVDAPVNHETLTRCAIAAQDGLARMIRPSHTLFDGDLFFASGLQNGKPTPAETMQLAVASELAVEKGIRNAVSLSL